jgi:proline iminopeptidase
MATIQANGVELAYEQEGDTTNPVILLVQGLGYPLSAWPASFVQGLVEAGYCVVRFDNRDVGLSSKMDHLTMPAIPQVFVDIAQGKPVTVPYSLQDMADDALALMDALSLSQVHLLGMSMGGMIAQTAAIAAPDRFLSLTCIMSSTSNPALPGPSDAVSFHLMSQPESSAPEHLLAHEMKTKKLIGSPAYPLSDEEIQAFVISLAMRGVSPLGVTRQTLAVMTASNRESRLAELNLPALVIHGEADPLVNVKSGVAIAKSIPNSQLKIFPGMGHEIPLPLVDEMVDLISKLCAQSKAA